MGHPPDTGRRVGVRGENGARPASRPLVTQTAIDTRIPAG